MLSEKKCWNGTQCTTPINFKNRNYKSCVMLIWKNLKKNGRLNYILFVLMIQYLGEFNARNRFVLMKDRLLVFKIIKIKIYLLLDIT